MARGWGRESDFAADNEDEVARVSAARSAYITRTGYEHLRAEYQQLWGVRRPEVVRALAAAAAEGDRSENAEYIYRKKELRELDRRVRYLQQRLPELKVVDRSPADVSRIFFGASVELSNSDDTLRRYRIVGADEIDAEPGNISVDSPMARALLKKKIGDVIALKLPVGEREFEVVSVTYLE